MIHPSSAFKSLEQPERQVLFTLFGVPWTYTRDSFQFPTSRLFMGVLIAFIFLRDLPLSERILAGLWFGVLVGISNIWHILGHQISGRMVGAPMDENLITRYSILTAYLSDPVDLPGRVHFVRAAGGPAATLLLALLSFLLWQVWGGATPAFLAILNLVLGILLSLPIPHADGEVIWREIGNLGSGGGSGAT